MNDADELTPKEKYVKGTDIDSRYAEPLTGKGKHEFSLALPANKGDRVTIEYPDDADVREAGEQEVLVILAIRANTVFFTDEESFDAAVESSDAKHAVRIRDGSFEGIIHFNQRVLGHAKRVTVERKKAPNFFIDI